MGNQVARVGNASHKKAEPATAMGAGNGSHGTNTAAVVSKSEPEHHNSHTQFFPIESLAKVQRLARLFKNVPGISIEGRMSCISPEKLFGEKRGSDTIFSVAKHFYSCLRKLQKRSLVTWLFRIIFPISMYFCLLCDSQMRFYAPLATFLNIFITIL